MGAKALAMKSVSCEHTRLAVGRGSKGDDGDGKNIGSNDHR